MRVMNSKQSTWVLGAFFSVIVLLAGWLYTGVMGRVNGLSVQSFEQGQQIVRQEQAQQDILRRLQSIETKLDRLLSK